MTYGELRAQYDSNEEFMKAFGALTEEEAYEMISKEPQPEYIKALIFDSWRASREVYLEELEDE